MPIINMASAKTEAEATVEMNSRNGANLRFITTPCSKFMGNDETGKSIYETVDTVIYLYDTHIGLCLEDREENGHDDSDFYMLVWNPETQSIDRNVFATTRGWSYPCYGSRPDATPEVRAAAQAYLRKRYLDSIKLQNSKDARTPAFGKTVKVVKGRKVAIGTTGEICWTGTSDFGVSRYGTWGKAKMRVGIRLLDGSKVFTDASNVEVLNPEKYEKPVADLEYTAAQYTPSTFVTSVSAGYVFM